MLPSELVCLGGFLNVVWLDASVVSLMEGLIRNKLIVVELTVHSFVS